MQLRTSLKRYLLLSLSGPLVLINPVSAKSLATDSAAATLGQLGSQWLNQSGHSEINLTGNTSKTLQGGGALLFPLLSGQQQLLFAQIGGHFGKTGNLLNTGIGQRWFTDQGHWGYNLFHDYHFNNHHQRLSLGLEWQHNNLSIALNGYQPLTDKRLIADTPESKTFERTARGFDLRCQYRLPQHPQLRLNLTGDRYLGEIVHNDSIVHNRSAVTVGFDYTPIPLITAGYGFNLDNAQNKAHQLQLTLTYRLGVPLAEQFEPQQVHIARSSLSNRLDLVQRNQQIVLEQLVECQALKTEDNDGGASPQSTPPEEPSEPKATESDQPPVEDNDGGASPQNTPSEEPSEPEATESDQPPVEDNDGGASPQNTPSEAITEDDQPPMLQMSVESTVAEDDQSSVISDDSGDDTETASTRATTPENSPRKEQGKQVARGLFSLFGN
ncbi:MAG: inverse autotransporter beta domain-containing protein [Candidatus Symbiodolus clandestinus]